MEGPYGRFVFDDANARQIWVAGGIGITPFIARMRQLATTDHKQVIDLIHTTLTLQPSIKEKLLTDTQASHVDLHLMIDEQDGQLSGEKLRSLIPDWQTASIWFCGPKSFGQALQTDLLTHGMVPGNFHQELFNLR